GCSWFFVVAFPPPLATAGRRCSRTRIKLPMLRLASSGHLDALLRGERMSLFGRDKSGERLPVSLITGFLGSGKTTLLNKLLRHPGMADSAVIINEFGEVSLDHLLVEMSRPAAVSLTFSL